MARRGSSKPVRGRRGREPAMVEIRHPNGAVILKLPARCSRELVMQHAAEYAARIAASRRTAHQNVAPSRVVSSEKADEADAIARLIREAFGIRPGQIVLR